jgi:hypothetical protein
MLVHGCISGKGRMKRSGYTMQLTGQILTGSTQTITTKKGDHLQKTRLKVLDLGPEANGGDVYWIDFLGDAALTDDELRQVARQSVSVEVRRMYASAGKQGGAFLNASGGAVILNGQIVQKGLRATPKGSAA